MSPEIDQFLVMGAIGAALGYFGMRFLRKKKGQCNSGSCCSAGQPAKKRRRK